TSTACSLTRGPVRGLYLHYEKAMITRVTRGSACFTLFLAAFLLAAGAQDRNRLTPKPPADHSDNINAAAEDISGMYSFLHDGEFIQLTLEKDGVSGYISRQGDIESDHGAFLDQFFDRASVKDHDVTFSTKPL